MDSNLVSLLFKFIAVFVLFLVSMNVIFLLMSKRDKNIDKKMKLYGILMNMNNFDLFGLACITIRYLFIMWCLLDGSNLSIFHVVVLFTLSLMFIIYSRKFSIILMQVFGNLGILLCFYCNNILGNYLKEVRFTWYVLVIDILLYVVVILYSLYDFIKSSDYIANNNKFIRRKNNESNKDKENF